MPVSVFSGKRNGNTTYEKKGWKSKCQQTYSQGHESNGCHLQITSFSYSCEERWGKTARKVLNLSNRGQKNRLEILPVLRKCVQGPFYQDNSNNMWQLQGIITLETNFTHIYVQNRIFLFYNILCNSLYKISWKIKKIWIKATFVLQLILLIEPWEKYVGKII